MTFSELLEISISTNLEFSEIILAQEMMETGRDPQKVKEALRKLMYVMLEEAEKNYGKEFNTLTNLTGNNGAKLSNAVPYMMSEFNHVATVVAISMGESNASMGRIVACPTAGSCGVMPGALYALKYVKKASDDELLKSFIVASGIGNVVAKRATLSGAAGGCQAEIGTATAMASSMITYYFSRDPVKVGNAAAISLKSLMGLVCDPVGGFVEVPCVKRNGSAVNVAIACAEMALAGIESVIPFDDVVNAMYNVGKSLPESLRETAIGGIAGTKSAQEIVEKIREKWDSKN
ncbi:MAG TPA: L-serine ammonia-lyase, iron-sulfur-dependent, subunit alpha [Fervidobacterium sp.]|nr:L-serine ammonia-lyase, iron-sulfur-dependent, subunit alpha [Fervidobacterium sp.]NLH37970.1 L-serine ammonia-lyase, iron-sulfur-dependent, subunit alpha [Thermotogaceae bacterium]MBP8657667.1 L-serine ammonia-lyase, iron-sulfur-dependent, subunit alpha [Fervidobacterium sp.]MBP9517880.1 L-serine ammonia-lyase, iron-sulfur-dependent, subunit alpha [Fervidobacterium sp.]HOA17043.1 L-serine ammonia-lyase, iron-sulfur-dependent, subunit alpha [Fervidobacterium sp.]